jgi:ABC-type transport system involved in multi-copper enzyme maturation permease subunit
MVHQLLGMIRYEFVMHWRRRALVGVTLSAIGVPLFLLVVFGQNDIAEIQRTWVAAGGVSDEAARSAVTRYAVTYGSMILYMILLLILPVLAADAIPHDRQSGVRELLDSLPLSPATYLLGKLAGFWVSVTAAMLAALIVLGAGWWLLLGPYHVDRYAAMWSAMLVGVGLVNSGLSLLLCAGQPNRRRAILIGALFATLCMFANVAGLDQFQAWWSAFSPGRHAITGYYLFNVWGELVASGLFTERSVALSIGAGLAEVALTGVIVWAWWRWRSGADQLTA